MLDNISWLDPIGGLVVSIMVIRAGWGNTGLALLELADVGVVDEIRGAVQNAATKALLYLSIDSDRVTSTNVEIRDIQGVKAGQSYLMSIEVAVPEDWTVRATRLVEEAIRENVGSKVRGVRRVRVRFVPNTSRASNSADELVSTEISPRSSPEPENELEIMHEHDGNHARHRSHEKLKSNGDMTKRR